MDLMLSSDSELSTKAVKRKYCAAEEKEFEAKTPYFISEEGKGQLGLPSTSLQKTTSQVNKARKSFDTQQFKLKRMNSMNRKLTSPFLLINKNSGNGEQFVNSMTEDETAIVYYVANLILLSQCLAAEHLIT